MGLKMLLKALDIAIDPKQIEDAYTQLTTRAIPWTLQKLQDVDARAARIEEKLDRLIEVLNAR